jgi:hypothetical protein
VDFLLDFLIQFVTKALGCDVTGKSEEFQSIPGCGLKACLSLLTVRYMTGLLAVLCHLVFTFPMAKVDLFSP